MHQSGNIVALFVRSYTSNAIRLTSRPLIVYPSTANSPLITCHIGAFCFDVRQFGAFQFGAFHFDAVPVRRVSLWRASTSARFTLARFPILYEPTVIRYLRTPVSRGLFVCMFLFRVSQFLLSKLMHNRLFDHLFPFCACFLRRSVVYASFAAKPLY